MKVQNLAIIFLVILIPLLVILSYYLNLQQETLEKQALYDTKLSEATKEGIKAFEVNTVDWSEWVNQKTKASERNDVKAAINTFITSLSNNLNISGTAKEFITNYIPAVVVTMYDGYYVYSPTNSPISIVDENGAQLFYNKNDGILTTESNNGKNLPAYKPKEGATIKTAENEAGETIEFVTSLSRAEKEYKHTLSSLIQYVEQYKNANANVIVNYTLDNRIYIKGTVSGKNVQKDGYLVYFNNKTELPIIKLKTNPQNSDDIIVIKGINETLYKNTQIEPEILEEQVIYFENGQTYLDTFKYIYDINDDKLYYDENEYEFFQLTADKVRDYKDDDPETKYKSLSVLLGDGKTTQYKKIYQVLNGAEKGQWYISIKDDSADAIYEGKEEIDTKLEGNILAKLGINNRTSIVEICKDYSAINYYVEAYAFTNWVESILGDTLVDNEEKGIGEYIFRITEENDPEEEYSPINEHKRRIMKEHIIKNLEISKYKIPQLTYNDWDQVFSNISIITFFQGPSIGLKYYNNYAIATSKTNREFVDPQEIYFRSSGDKNYHIVNCEKCGKTIYTGYRSVEYVLRENILYDSKYYYQHDKQTDSSAETACYYCVVNKANYQSSSNEEIAALQTKAYREALARERYFQKEQVLDKVNTDITIAVKKSEISIKNTDIIFILDDSGSMSAESINAVQEACSDIIDAMRLSENFYIGFIRFDTRAEEIGFATNQNDFDNLKADINEKYGGPNGGGTTNYEEAFKAAQKLLSDELFSNRKNKRIIVFMTDGIPNEGKSGEEVLKVLRNYHSYNVEEFYAIKFGNAVNNSLENLVKVFKYNYDPATDINILNADTTNILDTFKNILYSVNISSPEYIETKDGRLNLNDMDLSSAKPLNITVKKNGIALAPNPLVITQIETSNEVLIVEAGTIYLNLKGIQNVFGLDNFDGIEVEIEYYSKS